MLCGTAFNSVIWYPYPVHVILKSKWANRNIKTERRTKDINRKWIVVANSANTKLKWNLVFGIEFPSSTILHVRNRWIPDYHLFCFDFGAVICNLNLINRVNLLFAQRQHATDRLVWSENFFNFAFKWFIARLNSIKNLLQSISSSLLLSDKWNSFDDGLLSRAPFETSEVWGIAM